MGGISMKRNHVKKAIAVTAFAMMLVMIISSCGNKKSSLEDLQKVTTNTEDKSNNFASGLIANTDTGYYTWNIDKKHMMYFDNESEKQVILCNRPDCEHKYDADGSVTTDVKCNGYFSDEYSKNHILTYGNSIFLIKKVNKKGLYLTQIAENGHYREDLLCLTENTSEESLNNIILHRGYCYFAIESMKDNIAVSELYRVQLKKDAKPIKIDEIQGTSPIIMHIKGYEDEVYYVKFTCNSESLNNLLDAKMSYELKKYDIKTETISDVLDENIDDYVVDTVNNVLYYHRCGEAVYKCDLNTLQTEQIYSDNNLILCKLMYDGTNIYIDNLQTYICDGDIERKIYAIDSYGNIVKKIECPVTFDKGIFECGDSKYLFNYTYDYWNYIGKDSLNQNNNDVITQEEWKQIEWE